MMFFARSAPVFSLVDQLWPYAEGHRRNLPLTANTGRLGRSRFRTAHLIREIDCYLHLPRVVKQIAAALGPLLILAGGVYYYAITPHHSSAPPESAEGLLDRADTLAWGNRWAEAQLLYARAQRL